jgi:hypothetical protein
MQQSYNKKWLDSNNNFTLSLYTTIFLILLFPLQAKADAAVPTLLFIWPASWVLLLAIIPVEYAIARRILALDKGRCFVLSLTANAISSAAGIPIAWLVAMAGTLGMEISVYSLWKNVGSIGWYDLLVKITGQTLFLSPTPIESYFHKCIWTVPIAVLFLLLPYFFASVWIEKLVAQRFVQDKRQASNWSWAANSVSYGLMFIVLSCFLLNNTIRESSSSLLEGDIGATAGVDIYAFSKNQVDSLLAREISNGNPPAAEKFFAGLPFSDALAHTKTGPSSGEFQLLLPNKGDFVIAANYAGYQADRNGHVCDRQYFWLVRLHTNGENNLKLALTPQNMVDSDSPSAIKLEIRH